MIKNQKKGKLKETFKKKITRLGLQCQTPASFLYLTKSFGFFDQKEIQLTPSLFALGRKQILEQKRFKSEKMFVPKYFNLEIFWPQKNLVPK